MRIAIVAAGTTGDILPLIAIGKALVGAGHDVCFGTHTDFEGLVRDHGMEFRPIGGSFQALVQTDAGRAWIESGDNPVRYFRTTRSTFHPLLDAWAQDMHAAAVDCDLLLFHAMASLAYYTAEQRGIPSILLSLVPWVQSGEQEHVLMAPPPFARRFFNRQIWRLNQYAFWKLFGDYHVAHRARLGLPPRPGTPLRWMLEDGVPHLHLYSPSLLPRPDDWPAHADVNGFCFLDRAGDYQPPAPLQAFLDAGDPPIYVGFGSMTGRDPEELTRLTLDAITKSGKRAILSAGWGGLAAAELPESIFALDAAPHDWLFPRVCAVFHHGGAGTTAAGLRAARPTGIVAFFGDQPYWGRKIESLGLGAALQKRQLTPDRLADLIVRVSEDEAAAARCREVAGMLEDEDGVASVLAHIGRP